MSEPKRRHSTARKGRRLATRNQHFIQLVKCQHCGEMKIPHHLCKACGK